VSSKFLPWENARDGRGRLQRADVEKGVEGRTDPTQGGKQRKAPVSQTYFNPQAGNRDNALKKGLLLREEGCGNGYDLDKKRWSRR